jgi:NADPH:quinone reductase-like Zn-dependent oxidoreductase
MREGELWEYVPGETVDRGIRAVGVTEFGGPEVLHLLELPDPQAGPGEVRIRVHGAGVNPTDTGLRNGSRAELLKEIPPPYVPGMDAAGVLDQIDAGVSTDLQVGDHVMAIVVPNGSHGAYSERIVVPAESVARVPTGWTDVEAATLPMNGLTTRRALDLLGLEPGQTLAVTGAPGAVGGYAVQLGKADEELVKDLGADIVVRRGNEFSERVRRVVPEGADGLVDGALLNELVIPAGVPAGASPPFVALGGKRSAASPFIQCPFEATPVNRESSTGCVNRSRPAR